MPRLNLNPLSGLLPIELVPPTTGVSGANGGPDGSFDRHLEEARQAADGPSSTDRPATPEPRSATDDRRAGASDPSTESNDRASGETGPSGADDDRPTAAPSDTEPNADASENGSDAEQEGAGQAQSATETGANASDDQEEPGEEDGSGRNGAEAAAAQVGATGKLAGSLGDQGGDPASKGVSGELQEEQEAKRAARGKGPSDPNGRLLSGGVEEAGQAEAQAIPDEDGADGSQAGEAEEAGTHGAGEKDLLADQLGQSTGAGNQSGESGADASGTAGSQASDESGQDRRSASDSRGQSGRHAAKDLADAAIAEDARNVESTSTEQRPRIDPNAGLAAQMKTGLGETTANATSSDRGEGEAVGPTRAGANQASRQASTTRGEGPSGPDQADRVRFVNRVARAFATVGDRGGSVRLRLHPPELGSLRLDITVRNGTMTARLEVETAGARNMLLDNLPALRERLAEQDIKVGRFDVDLTDRSPDGSPERPDGQPQSPDHSNQHASEASTPQKGEAERSPSVQAVARPGEGDQLDVVI